MHFVVVQFSICNIIWTSSHNLFLHIIEVVTPLSSHSRRMDNEDVGCSSFRLYSTFIAILLYVDDVTLLSK